MNLILFLDPIYVVLDSTSNAFLWRLPRYWGGIIRWSHSATHHVLWWWSRVDDIPWMRLWGSTHLDGGERGKWQELQGSVCEIRWGFAHSLERLLVRLDNRRV